MSAQLNLHDMDPIFAAIEADRATDATLLARALFEDGLPEEDPRLAPAPDDHRTPELVRLVDASITARQELASLVPTTLAGLLAVLRFVRERSQDDFLFDGDEESARFVASLEQAVLAMTAT
jgi:hypothetical protein